MEAYLRKIKSISEMMGERDSLKAAGKAVVAAGGCFDILHPGHLQTLSSAKRLGDALIVLLNSDASVRALKGPTRPVIPEESRAQMLAALEFVDYVVIFDEISPAATLRVLQPDYFCKGEEYHPERGTKQIPLDESSTLEEYGGQVSYLPLVSDNSTTAIIASILAAYDRDEKQ